MHAEFLPAADRLPARPDLLRFAKVHEPGDALREVLAAGPMNSQAVAYEMALRGFSAKQTRRAREIHNVVVQRFGCGKLMHSVWGLPADPRPAPESETLALVAPPADKAGVLKIVKVQAHAVARRRTVKTARSATSKTGGEGRIHAPVQLGSNLPASDAGLLRIVKVSAPALTEAEANRLNARVEVFVRRGVDLNTAQRLATALVERDRIGGREFSCAECQCFVEPQLPCPTQPRAVGVLHPCAFARKSTP